MKKLFEQINFKAWRFWKNIVGITIGALAGFLYYFYVGCASGTCPITGNPYISTLWGAMIGYLLFSSFDRETKPEKRESVNGENV